MTPNELSPQMKKAIGLERIYTDLLDNETLAVSSARRACEQAKSRTFESLTLTEQALMTSLQLRIQFKRLKQEGSLDGPYGYGEYSKWEAQATSHRRAAKLHPEVDESLIDEFLFMVGDEFEYYDPDGERWDEPAVDQDAEVIHPGQFIRKQTHLPGPAAGEFLQ